MDRGDGEISENRGDRSPEVISSEGEDSRSSNQDVVWKGKSEISYNNFQFHNPTIDLPSNKIPSSKVKSF